MRFKIGKRTGAVCPFVVIASAALGCGSAGGTASRESIACEAGECAGPAPRMADAGGTVIAVRVDAADGRAEAGDDGSISDAAHCVPEAGPDIPDDSFSDTNCDGIDGDAAHAIFVSPGGQDSAPGSMAAPVKSIGKALALASVQGRDVYVCNGTYAEAVTVTAAVGIFGGYDCAHGWQRVDDVFVLAPSASGGVPSASSATDGGAVIDGESAADAAAFTPGAVPLTVQGVSGAVTLDHGELLAPDAIALGTSSIASRIVNSIAVTFRHVMVQAGAGADGQPGSPVEAMTTPATTGADGQSGMVAWTCSANELSAANIGACYDRTVVPAGGQSNPYLLPLCEGAGGVGASTGQTAGSGEPSALGGSAGNLVEPPGPGKPGNPGSAGSPAPQDIGNFSIGTFDANGYTPSNVGADGTPGSSGGGGGGGASDPIPRSPELATVPLVWAAGGGGQGGYGGCGGAGGHGGGGGGASIGVLAVSSVVSWTTGSVATGAGGRGGIPSAGAAGQPGGPGGSGGQNLMAYQGGTPGLTGGGHGGAAGGPGGKGGPGGPGGGGPSIGVVTVGATVSTTGVAFNIGAGGAGGQPLSGPNGPEGLSTSTFQLNAPDAGSAADGG